ncbi:hypothetical protein BDP27DRAFT_862810 [Rhodocollybia butyracea]|uniref:Zinc-finger domain-containing protein n=1 Tax=Rhodocollybia butyracea TaxID=206335 RepID=A0A9P5U7G7_9AGAR|nr:hypothetical protein BDP27DRAFT_862810 [Rhodocollybia butyracea]
MTPSFPSRGKKPILVPSREASPVRIPGDVLALQKDAHGDELVMLYVGKQWDFMAFPGLFEFEFEDETKGDDPFVQLNLGTNSGSVRTMNTRWIRQSNESRQALLLASGESERERQESPRPVGDGKGKGNFIPPLSLSFSSSSTRLWKGKPLGMDATPGKCFEEYWLPGGDRDHEDDGKDESNILPTLDISSDSDSEDSDSSVDSVSQRPTKALTTSAVTPAVTSSLTSTATGARKEWPEGDLTYYCHQCRRPTTRVYMKCKNEGTKCKIKYCIRCVTQRYPQVEFNTSRTDFTCLRCQGICNCDLCCKKRGDTYLPTKFLFENLDAPFQENTPLKHANLSEREGRVLPVLSAKGKEKEKFVPPSSASARLGKDASRVALGRSKVVITNRRWRRRMDLNIIDVSSDSDNDSDDAGSDSRPTKTSTTALTSTLPTSHSKPKLTSLPKLAKPTLGTPSTASTQRAKLPIPKTNKPTQRPVASGSHSTSTNPTHPSLASFSPPSSLASLLPKASSASAASAHGSGKGSSRFTGSSSTNAAGPSTLKHSTQIGSPAPRLGRNLKEVVQGGSSSGLEGHASASSSRVPSAMGPGPAGPQPSQGSTATESQPTPSHSVLLRKWDEKGAESLTIGEMRELVEALRIKSTEGVVNGLNGTHTTEEEQRQDLESRQQEQHRSQPDDGNDDGKEKKRKRATSGVDKVRSVHTTEEGPLVGPQDLDSLRKDHHRDDEDDDGKKKKRKRASGVENVGSVHTTEEGPVVGPRISILFARIIIAMTKTTMARRRKGNVCQEWRRCGVCILPERVYLWDPRISILFVRIIIAMTKTTMARRKGNARQGWRRRGAWFIPPKRFNPRDARTLTSMTKMTMEKRKGNASLIGQQVINRINVTIVEAGRICCTCTAQTRVF